MPRPALRPGAPARRAPGPRRAAPARAAAALALLAAAGPLAAAEDPAHGLWRTEANAEGGYLEVELGPCAGAPEETCGVIRRAVTPAGEAPGYPHLGRVMIEGMTRDGRAYAGGTIWAPDDDETYRSEMTLSESGEVLQVEGCVLVFCRGQDWTRVAAD